jgi:hypothetical protein
MSNDRQCYDVFPQLEPGDRVELEHEVKVGFNKWRTTTVGTVVSTERRRHSLHYQRNFDDKVFSDNVVLELEGGELTTVTLDEFSKLRKLQVETDAAAEKAD